MAKARTLSEKAIGKKQNIKQKIQSADNQTISLFCWVAFNTKIMKRILLYTLCTLLVIYAKATESHKNQTDANLVGHVISKGAHLPFVSIFIKGTNIGTVSDETGHFKIVNLPLGNYTLVASCIGYRTTTVEFAAEKSRTLELNIDMVEDHLGLDEVVVTGNRGAEKRTESSVVVTSLTSKLFSVTQSSDLKEGLNYCPGLRAENNCGNCGFTQVRMNGMEGPYSQILVNSRPIFSGLTGVYGLELIPSNMIERVEIIRGGGSALYGSNAIAGTINMILKDPISNTYEFDASMGLLGVGMSEAEGVAIDQNVKFNTSIVSADLHTGLAIYGNYRKRDPFDANNDGFSNLVELKNTTIGSRLSHRFDSRNKIALDFFHINEDRRGGDRFDYPEHEALIAESVKHEITTAALDYSQLFREQDELSVYAAGQFVNRDSYYGAEYSLSDYGNTRDFTHTLGAQYKAHFKQQNILLGVENIGGNLHDQKLGYYDVATDVHLPNTTVSKQLSNTAGVFGQYEVRLAKLTTTLGLRYDNYNIKDKAEKSGDISGNVLSPRLSLKYDLAKTLQARASYSQGYRAPQIFDEDLHIETSGSRKVLHINDPELKQETSHSFMASLDYNKEFEKSSLSVLFEGFYTRLRDPFQNSHSAPDENGVVTAFRSNASGAVVQGVNLEVNYIPTKDLTLNAGFTLQSSTYDEEQEDFPEKRFFRTPNDYGFFTFTYAVNPKFDIAATGNYTGKMLVPHFGLDPDTDIQQEIEAIEKGDVISGEQLKTSSTFFDLGLNLRYTTRLNATKMQFYAGLKNMLNAYQSDLDRGLYRDPGYVYGPGQARTLLFGVKIGNAIR